MSSETSVLTEDEIAHSIRLTEHQLLRRDQLAREEAQRAAAKEAKVAEIKSLVSENVENIVRKKSGLQRRKRRA